MNSAARLGAILLILEGDVKSYRELEASAKSDAETGKDAYLRGMAAGRELAYSLVADSLESLLKASIDGGEVTAPILGKGETA